MPDLDIWARGENRVACLRDGLPLHVVATAMVRWYAAAQLGRPSEVRWLSSDHCPARTQGETGGECQPERPVYRHRVHPDGLVPAEPVQGSRSLAPLSSEMEWTPPGTVRLMGRRR